MTNEYIVKPASVPPYLAAGYHFAGEFGGGVLLLHTEDPTLPGDTLVARRLEGEQAATIMDATAYQLLRPFGNAEDGSATGELRWSYIDGWPHRLFPSGKPYPDDNQPFDAEARHVYFDTPQTPASTGWGFRVELIGDSGTRDPNARAIGVYSDPGCATEDYLWTTGALSLGPSLWQVDGDGNPLTVWFTDSWDGDRPDERKDWHIAFLLGSAQEGHQTLPAAQDNIRYLFWEHEQGWTPPPDADWVDTGLTIIAQAGQAYRLSGVPSDLTIGQALRLGPTEETTLLGYWPVLLTPSDYIQIDPFVQVATGLTVWKWA